MSMSNIMDCCDQSIKQRLEQGKRKKFYQTLRRIIPLLLAVLFYGLVRSSLNLFVLDWLAYALLCLVGIIIIRYLVIVYRVRQVMLGRYPTNKAMALTLRMEGIRV